MREKKNAESAEISGFQRPTGVILSTLSPALYGDLNPA
jgi:cyanate permease